MRDMRECGVTGEMWWIVDMWKYVKISENEAVIYKYIFQVHETYLVIVKKFKLLERNLRGFFFTST